MKIVILSPRRFSVNGHVHLAHPWGPDPAQTLADELALYEAGQTTSYRIAERRGLSQRNVRKILAHAGARPRRSGGLQPSHYKRYGLDKKGAPNP